MLKRVIVSKTGKLTESEIKTILSDNPRKYRFKGTVPFSLTRFRATLSVRVYSARTSGMNERLPEWHLFVPHLFDTVGAVEIGRLH